MKRGIFQRELLYQCHISNKIAVTQTNLGQFADESPRDPLREVPHQTMHVMDW